MLHSIYKTLFLKIFIVVLYALQTDAGSFFNTKIIDRMFVTGLNVSFSSRYGVYELSSERKQTKKVPLLPMYGVELGKRFAIGAGFRVFIPAEFNFGFTKEITELIDIVDNEGHKEEKQLFLKRKYLHVGFNPQIQYRISILDKISYLYLIAGGGVNYVNHSEAEWFNGTSGTKISVNDPYLDEGSALSKCLVIGAGLDFSLSKKRGLSFVYKLKFWEPINYLVTKDIFPVNPIRYKETFNTHVLGFQFLLR